MRQITRGILFIVGLFFQQQAMAQLPILYSIDAAKAEAIKKNAATNKATAEKGILPASS